MIDSPAAGWAHFRKNQTRLGRRKKTLRNTSGDSGEVVTGWWPRSDSTHQQRWIIFGLQQEKKQLSEQEHVTRTYLQQVVHKPRPLFNLSIHTHTPAAARQAPALSPASHSITNTSSDASSFTSFHRTECFHILKQLLFHVLLTVVLWWSLKLSVRPQLRTQRSGAGFGMGCGPPVLHWALNHKDIKMQYPSENCRRVD